MITVISGLPGGGKSYEAVKYHILPALRDSRKVITNLPVDPDYCADNIEGFDDSLLELVEFDYADFEARGSNTPFSKPDDYSDEWRNSDGVGPLYVIDEAHYSLPRSGTPEPVKKFYYMHRHYGVDIVLVTQFPRQLDRDIQQLIELVHRCIKNTALGSPNTYIKKVQQGYRGQVVNEEIRKYDSDIFPYYKSHTQSNTAVLEAATKDVKPIWKTWPFIGSLLFIVLALFIFAKAAFGGSNNDEQELEVIAETQVVENKANPTRTPTANLQRVNTKTRAPFDNVTLHISGSSEFTELVGSKLTVNRVTHFVATRENVPLFEIDHIDLIRSGYVVEVLSSCVVRLIYREVERWVICDDPRNMIAERKTGYEVGNSTEI